MLLDGAPLTIDADHATNDKAGAPDCVGSRDVLVAVGDCDCHGETVAEALVSGQ